MACGCFFVCTLLAWDLTSPMTFTSWDLISQLYLHTEHLVIQNSGVCINIFSHQKVSSCGVCTNYGHWCKQVLLLEESWNFRSWYLRISPIMTHLTDEVKSHALIINKIQNRKFKLLDCFHCSISSSNSFIFLKCLLIILVNFIYIYKHIIYINIYTWEPDHLLKYYENN